MPANGAKIMRGIRLRMRRAVPVQQRQQMRAVRRPVPLGRVTGLFDRQKRRRGRGPHRRKRPCMQFVHKRIAQRMIINRWQ